MCGCMGQRWVLGLSPGLAFRGGPRVFPAHPRVQIHVQGAGWGDSSGVAVSRWLLPLRTWERAQTCLLSRIFSRSGPPGVKAGLPEADAWLGRTPSGGLCSSVLCFSPHRAHPKGISDDL